MWVRYPSASLVAIAAITVLMEANPAWSAYCSTTQVHTSNHTMTADYVSAGIVPCFEMRSGANLNMNGHTITCTAGSCPATAVSCTSDGSVVQDTSAGHDGAILGPWDVGTEGCSSVKKILIDGPDVAIDMVPEDGRTNAIVSNVIKNCSDVCIDAEMEDALDKIEDNRIEPGGGDGIHIDGRSRANGPRIRDNVLVGYDVGILDSAASDYVRIDHNLMLDGTDPLSITSSNVTFSQNVCEESEADCACSLEDVTNPVDCFDF